MAFTDRLKAARKRSGLTQLDVARKLGLLNAQSYAQYEQGTRKPKQDTLNKIADALQLSYTYAQNGEPYFYCFVDTVSHGDKDEKFNTFQYNDAITSNSDINTHIPIAKQGITVELRDGTKQFLSTSKLQKIIANKQSEYFDTELFEAIDKLNNKGQKKVKDYANDLAENSKYRKDSE